jgi:hypothetical protein
MSKVIVTICVMALSLLTFCQQRKESEFSLIFLSNEIKYDAKSLYNEIKMAKSLEEVKTLVQKKITDNKGRIMVMYKSEGLYFRWERTFGKNAVESTEEWIVLGRRDIGQLKVSSPEEFAEVLYDTIVVLDTLKVMAGFNSQQFPVKNYSLRYSCNNKINTAAIPVIRNNELLITRDALLSCTDKYPSVTLFNRSSDSITLCNFIIFLPSTELLSELLSIARGLKRNPSLDKLDIPPLMESYISGKYGNCSYGQINHWLSKQL